MSMRAPRPFSAEPIVDLQSGGRSDAGWRATAERALPWWRRMVKGLRPRISSRARTNAETAASRTYRQLARRILADFAPTEGGRRIIVASTGSVTLCTEALLMLAYFIRDELGCRILLVDDPTFGDTVGERLGFSSERGLLDSVHENDRSAAELIQPTARAGISILPKGMADPDALSAFQLRRIPLILQEATRRFDYVLVQQSSILDDRRHRSFAAGADLSLLFVEEGTSSMDELELYQRAMTDAQAQNVRLVLCTSA